VSLKESLLHKDERPVKSWTCSGQAPDCDDEQQ